MKESTIKFNLIKLEDSLVFQVIKQSAYYNYSFVDNNNIMCNVKSVEFPEIRINGNNFIRNIKNIKSIDFFLMGDNSKRSKDPIIIKVFNNEIRDQLYDLIIYSIKEWSINKPDKVKNNMYAEQRNVRIMGRRIRRRVVG